LASQLPEHCEVGEPPLYAPSNGLRAIAADAAHSSGATNMAKTKILRTDMPVRSIKKFLIAQRTKAGAVRCIFGSWCRGKTLRRDPAGRRLKRSSTSVFSASEQQMRRRKLADASRLDDDFRSRSACDL
jgi:hypothetical protein